MDLSTVGHVIEGHRGQLFLAGGAHEPLAHLLGKRPIPMAAIRNLRQNLRRRTALAARRGLPYVHLVAPDKHSVLREDFPVADFRSVAEQVRERCKEPFLWPAQALRDLHRATPAYPATDTHWTDAGAIHVTMMVAEALGIEAERIERARAALTARLRPRREPVYGDLGRTMDPPRGDERLSIKPAWPLKLSNNGVKQNNGRLLLSLSGHANASGRLLIFGDSFAMGMLVPLSVLFGAVLLCRSPRLHPEMLAMYRPTHLMTEMAERYLVSTPSDREAVPFLMLAGTADRPASYAPGHFEAIAAALTGRVDDHVATLRSEAEQPA